MHTIIIISYNYTKCEIQNLYSFITKYPHDLLYCSRMRTPGKINVAGVVREKPGWADTMCVI